MTEFSDNLLVLTSCKGSITAKKIATEVVVRELGTSARIINDVNIFTRWGSKVENTEEQLLLIRTSSANYEKLEKCIKQLHPLELPEIIPVPFSINMTDSNSG